MDVKTQIILNILDEVTKKYDEIFSLKEKLLQEAEYKSNHDILTDLYNREYFQKRVKKLIEEDIPFALAFIDLDNFKYVNDNFGHDAGDNILMDTAEILRKNLKGQDIIARFGGDEFIAVVINCNEECANKVFYNIQKEINSFFQDYKVTSSIGVAFYPNIKSYEDLLKKADENMYKSKKEGKDRVTL